MAAAGSLALTILALALLRRAIKSRRAAIAAALGFLFVQLLLITHYSLNSLTGSGIDESVLFHLVAGMKGGTTGDFTAVIVVAAMLVVAAFVTSYLAYRFIRAGYGDKPSRFPTLGGTAALLAAFVVNPTVLDVGELALKYGGASLRGSPRVPPPPEYVAVDERDAKGMTKNLVLLYIESFERTYLDETLFPGLAPNLRALEERALSFTDMTQPTWASWTIGGWVASQCGIPVAGSSAGSDRFLPAATCIGDLLHSAGYDMSFLQGSSLEFAGGGPFYATHGFDAVEGADELLGQLDDPDYRSIWGIYDDTLLALAADRFDQKAAGDTPFGMILSTIDTHHPQGGIVSETCKDIVYADGADAFLNAVHCADHMAGAFIRHVLDSPAMDDTVLVVMSDHLARPNSVWDVLETADPRNLFLAFGSEIEPGKVTRPGSTFDVAPTILSLLGADIPAMGFGRNLLGPTPSLRSTHENIDQLLENNWRFLSSLADFPQLDAGIRVDLAEGKAYLGERFVTLPVLFQLDENLRVLDILYGLDDGNKLPRKLADLWYDDRFVWVDSCDRIAVLEGRKTPLPTEYCALAGSLGSPGLTSFPLPDGVPLRYDRLEAVLKLAEPDEAYYDSVIGEILDRTLLIDADVVRSLSPAGFEGDFVVRSTGGSHAWESWVVNRAQGDLVYVGRGLTLLGLNPTEAPAKIVHKDTCGWGGIETDPDAIMDSDFGTAIERSSEQYEAFVIVLHSSAVCGDDNAHLDELFVGTEFTRWRELSDERPYVAVLASNGNVTEIVGAEKTALVLELRDFIRPEPANAKPLVFRDLVEPRQEAAAVELPLAPVLSADLCRYARICSP